MHAPRFVDLPPREVFATLLDEGTYLCSWRTMYRVLRDHGETRERRLQRRHQQHAIPRLVARSPNEVWSWDITLLRGQRPREFFYLYVILDLYSRYVVGWMVAPCESDDLAEHFINRTCERQGVLRAQLTLHADRGSVMRSHLVSELLKKLGVDQSHSRPRVSNDNPMSESQFKTLKYHATFPGRFDSIHAARAFCREWGDRYLEGEIRLPRAAAIPFELPSELLGDMRALNKTLARLMGSHYRVPPAQKQRQILNAWLSTAEGAEQVELLHDYGFAHDGRSFVDHSGTLPEGIRSFRAPAHMAAARLNLEADGAPPPAELAASLLDLWPRVLGCPATVSALMGIVGWGLVAPVLEANNPGVSPLLAFIVGRSGAGKSTHACVVQCFFGDYRDTKCALPFSSTPLAIELESHFFRGAVMVVGDVKSSAIVQGRHAQVLGLIQRAGDRAKRYRLQATGQADHARASRATWLLEGEDVPVTDSSALARMLQLRLPEVTKVPALADELEQLLLYLPTLTRALVLHLLATQPWARLGARYRSLSQALTELAGTASNGVRLAKHIAAVVVGAEVWSSFLATLGLALPADSDALVQHLVVMGHEQLGELEEATPGERFLELLRQLLAGGLAQLGEHEDGGEVVGQWSEDGRIAYLLPAPALGLLRRHFPDAAAGLPPPASIAADLARKDALAETDQGRRTKKARVGGRSVNTWALRGELVRG